MNKIFGTLNTNGKDWFTSEHYNENKINGIIDPEGGTNINMPPAIPSPFARLDLVKTAFRNIINSPKLSSHKVGDKVVTSKEDEKLVSDCLDIAELLFNYESVKDKVKIVVWDKQIELNKLKNSVSSNKDISEAHRMFAETLELYLDQDKASYNFDLMKRIYLIKYNHKIIGGTSPITLFFATANNLDHAKIHLNGNDTLFDENYTPLYKRDSEFQKYLYLLFKSNSILSTRMRDFSNYLEKNKRILNVENVDLYNQINNLNVSEFKENFTELNTGITNSDVEVLGVVLKKRRIENVTYDISNKSDFRISSTKDIGTNRPLVLQNDFSKNWLYVNDHWMNTIKVAYFDKESINNRRLPGLNIKYPYLTVSDFLEPYLIRLVYPINKEKYFDGNLKIEIGNDSKGYLLPLKKYFFEYFNSEDLINSSDRNPKIELIQGGQNSVKVILKIPVAKHGEYISFERIYYQSSETQITRADEESNNGIIVENQVGVTLFPFLRTKIENYNPQYRIQLIDRDIFGIQKNSNFDLKFFSNTNNNELSSIKKIRNKKIPDDSATASSQYYVLNNEFDFIQIRNQANSGISGIIIPIWPQFNHGNEEFSFAIDFGTTNSHIEYKISNNSPKPFEINLDEIQIGTLYHPTKTSVDFSGSGANAIRELIEHEFVPFEINNNSHFKFPQRTVISESHSLNIDDETYSLADFNIPFIYEKKVEKDKIHSNLKWSKREIGNLKRIESFFEILIMLIRNKTLLNKGNLNKTKLVWFYPSSMKQARKSVLEKTWNELFNKFFNQNVKSIGITESLAPFYYFKGHNQLTGGSYKPVVSIDIGGGTTDIVIFKQNEPLKLTSIKFAANSIFGDGFSEYGAANTNGFIIKYKTYFHGILNTNKHYELIKVLKHIEEKNKSEDINAFFFSLENNSRINNSNIYSYNALLSKDDDLKIIFIYFYSSIIYHIAKLMKHHAIELPKNIIFSGTGSKILKIITPNLETLSKLSKKIFEFVYSQQYDNEGLKLTSEYEKPKEVTCKGGLMMNKEDLSIDTNTIKVVHTCLEEKGIKAIKYSELNDEIKEQIIDQIKDFNSFFINLNKSFKYSDNFGVSSQSFAKFKKELDNHLRDYLETGLEFSKKLDSNDDDIDRELEETLFFYPIIGKINELTEELSKLSEVQN